MLVLNTGTEVSVPILTLSMFSSPVDLDLRVVQNEDVRCFSTDESEIDLGQLSGEGFNVWLASLPEDDWSELYEQSTPIKWVPGTGWVEG